MLLCIGESKLHVILLNEFSRLEPLINETLEVVSS